jgi:hypothetical protein
MTKILLLTDDKVYRLYILDSVVKDIDKLKDKRAVKSIKTGIG